MKKENLTGRSIENIRLNLQIKLTIVIVVLIFLIISLRTIFLGYVHQYIENTLLLNIISAGIGIVFGAVAAYFIISLFLKRPLNKLTEMANWFMEGDFTRRIDINTKDEFEQLAHAFNIVAENNQKLISEIKISSEQLAASAEELSASAEQAGKATEQISATTQEVAFGTEKQVQSVQETSRTINEMSVGSKQIATSSQQVSTTAVGASEKALQGNQAIKTAIKQMNSINSTVNGLSEVVKGLGNRSKEIGHIILDITDIASQTNLLALNAAIEAARAGEHGRGFAVVADEVRKLAEQSAQSAHQITQLVATIQDETSRAVQSMEKTTNEVVEGIGVVNKAGDSFEQVQHSINEVVTQIKEVSSSVQQMSAGTELIVHSVNR
jgi:methyl-accepting chemotaxis protein